MSDQDLAQYLRRRITELEREHPRTVGGQLSKQSSLRELRARVEELEAEELTGMRVTR